MGHADKLNFQHLSYLQTLVQERSVTRAAERVGIGQPAMSSTLSKLRQVFKDPLLVQTRNGMQPTPRALEIIHRSREIMALLQGRGLGNDHYDPQYDNSHWKIMSSDGIARGLLPRLMKSIQHEAPEISLTVHPGDPRRILDHLRDNEFDLAVTFTRNPALELRQTSLYSLRLVCIARQGHPLLKGKINLKQFSTLPQVKWGAPPLNYATMEALVDEALAKLGTSRRIQLSVTNLTLLPGIVGSSDLIAVMPDRSIDVTDKRLQVLPLPFKVSEQKVTMIWHEKNHRDPAHQWLRQKITDIYLDKGTSFK